MRDEAAKVAFGLRIRSHRKRLDMTQQQLADAVEKHVDTISNIERGLLGTRLETATRLASALDVPLQHLFEISGEHLRNPETDQLVQEVLTLIKHQEPRTLKLILEQTEFLLRAISHRRN